MSHKNFKVRAHKWIEGVLHIEDNFFATIDEAHQHIESAEGEVFKIMNTFGQVIHEHKKQNQTFTHIY